VSNAAPADPRALTRAALRAVEVAADAIPDVEEKIDRVGIGVRLHHAIESLYTALDKDVDDVAHTDGLRVAARILAEVDTMSRRVLADAPSAALVTVLGGLGDALTRLEDAANASARIQLTARNFGRRSFVPPPRPFQASIGVPHLQSVPRGKVVMPIELAASSVPPPPPAPRVRIDRPKTLEQLQAFHEAAKSGALAAKLEEASRVDEPPPPPPPPPELAYEPSIEEGEMQRTLARDCLEDLACLAFLRKPIPSESWLDQAPFEQRLLNNLDAFASFGGVGLPIVSQFHAEADIPDPARAFACSLALGSLEGTDTARVAATMMSKAPPEELPGFATGLWLAPNTSVDEALVDLLEHARADVVAAATRALADRGSFPPGSIALIAAHKEPIVQLALCRALGRCPVAEAAMPVLERLLFEMNGAVDDEVFGAAAEASLRHGVGSVRDLLRQTLAKPPSPRRAQLSAWLLSLTGRPEDLDLLVGNALGSASPLAIRALGRFGHLGAFDALRRLLSAGDEDVVEEAATALELICGSGMIVVSEVPWDVSLPDDIDLEEINAGPIPGRKVEKVVSDRATWKKWWREHGIALDPAGKYRHGHPFRPVQLCDELVDKRTSTARRFDAALELALVAGPDASFAPDDWVARQKERLTDIRGRVVNLSNVVGAWWFAGASTRGITPRSTSSSAAMRAVITAGATPDTAPAALVSADPGTVMDMSSFSPEDLAAMVAFAPAQAAAAAAANLPPPVEDAATALTLLEFAMLAAELQVFPDHAERAFAKYGLTDPAKRAAVNAAWNARIARDPEERAEYHRLHDRAVRHWLSTSTR
jgi:hypothetical protein